MKRNREDHRPATAASLLTRRRMLQSAGGLLAAAALPAGRLAGATPSFPQDSSKPHAAATDLTGQLARYMVQARDRALPAKVTLEGKHHILDTLGAMVSGSRLKAGEMATAFVRTQGGTAEASVIASNIRTTAINAALANGMCGHGDETDDVELVTKTHPGISSVAAALAMAEREGRSGMELLRAVVLGYDVCARFLWRSADRKSCAARTAARKVWAQRCPPWLPPHRSPGWTKRECVTHCPTRPSKFPDYGAGRRTRTTWRRPLISRAWARNGVTAAIMVQAGFTGVHNVFDCEHNVLEALSSKPQRDELLSGLGSRYWIAETSIKTYSVGYPIQPALDAFLTLRRENSLSPENVDHIVVRLPADAAGIVDNSAMPDVNLQYVIAVALIDGEISFADSHSRQRMADPKVRAVKERVKLIADPKLVDPAAPRSGLVEVTLKDGRTVTHFTKFAPGTKEIR